MSTTADVTAARRIESVTELKRLANRLRIEIIKMIGAAGSGHPGGSLSEVELLAALYFRVLRHNPKEAEWADRDRFILSKGYGCPALYAVLAEAGYIDHSVLGTLRKLGSRCRAILIGAFCRCWKPTPDRWGREFPWALGWRWRRGWTKKTGTRL